MAARLVVTPEAEKDIAAAYDWYEQCRYGLGEEYLNCVDACIERIRRSPEIHAIAYQDFRRALVRRFPFAVFYEYDGETLIVCCVFHTAQNPSKWRDRLG